MILEFDNVTFAHDQGRKPGKRASGASSPEEPVLRGVSFSVAPGGFVVVRGESGAGKSTLLRLACRLEEPRSGAIRFQGRDLSEYAPPRLRRRLAYVPQTPATGPGTVRDNLLLPFAFKANADLTAPSDAELAERMAAFRLEPDLLDRDAENLSVGQRQRVCLIRSLLLNPEMLLMDEPASALDAKSAEIVMNAAENLNQERGVAVMVVTHDAYTPGAPHADLLVEHGAARLL